MSIKKKKTLRKYSPRLENIPFDVSDNNYLTFLNRLETETGSVIASDIAGDVNYGALYKVI